MRGWNDRIDWADGADGAAPADGRAHPSDRAGYPADPSRSSRQPGPAERGNRAEPGRPESGWSDQPTDRWQHVETDDPDRPTDDRWDRVERSDPAEPADRPQRSAARWAEEPADLGAFEVGRLGAAETTDRRTLGDDRRRDGVPRDGTGRHRRQSRLRAPVALGVAVTGLLGLFGVGAALLPASLTGAPDGARPDQPAVEAAGSDDPTAPTDVAEQTATPTPTATTARPTPKPKARTTAPKPSRTTSPPARRTPAQSGSGASAAGDSREAQVLTIVNRERAANGCGSVVINSDLTEAARLHSQDQGEHTNMSHTGSDGSTFVERARRAGYDNPIGENVAMGYPSAAAVMEGWMNSSGHRANILNCDAKAMGVGVATGADGRLYWTQIFGSVA